MAVSTNTEVTELQAPPRQVTKNALIYFFGQLLSWIATFCAVSIIPTLVGIESQGQIILVANKVMLFYPLLTFGIDVFIMREVGQDHSRAEWLVRSCLGLRIAIFPLLILLSLLTLSFTKNMTPMIWKMGYLGIIFITFVFFSDIFRATLGGLEEAKRVSLTELIFSVSPLLAIPFLKFGNPLPYQYMVCIGGFIVLAIRWNWVRKRTLLRPIFNISAWKEILKGGLPYVANNMILQILSTIAIFMLEYLDSHKALGIYGQALKLFGTFLFIPTALGMALMPSLARLGEEDKEQIGGLQERVMVLLIVLGLPLMTLVMLLAEPLAHILYRKSGSIGIPADFLMVPMVLRIYALAIIPMYLVTALYQFLVAQNRGGIWTR